MKCTNLFSFVVLWVILATSIKSVLSTTEVEQLPIKFFIIDLTLFACVPQPELFNPKLFLVENYCFVVFFVVLFHNLSFECWDL